MKQVLLIDDDQLIHSLVKGSIQNEYTLISCYSLAEAEKLLESSEPPSIILIDRMLPDGDGLSICARIRAIERTKSTPIIFLSGKDSEGDKVSGLFAGADDYVTKPFGPLELKARIQARLRSIPQKLFIAGLEIDLESQRVLTIDQRKEIDLTRIEYKMLVTLAQSLNRVFNRNTLLDKVWGANCNISDRVVDTHLSHLRKKIAGTGIIIESLRGEGYRLRLV